MALERIPTRPTATVYEQKIPYLPWKIRLSDIKEVSVDGHSSEWRFYWHTKAEREHILAALKDKEDGWYKKSSKNGAPFDSPDQALQLGEYDIIVHNGMPFALYHGINSNTHIGAGTYGTVKYAQHILSGKLIAIKIFSTYQRTEPKTPFRVHSLDTIHHTASQEHYFLARLAKLALPQGYVGARYSEKKGDQFYNLMKLELGLDLQDFYANYPAALGHNLYIMKQIAQLIQVLHQKFLHRDLKMDNLVINPRTGEIKSVDFGMSCRRSEEPYGMLTEFKENGSPRRVGTGYYMAPENYHGRYSTLSDIFSIGEIYVRLLFFFKPEQRDPRMTQLLAPDAPNALIQDVALRKELYRLCVAMKNENEKERPSLNNIMQFLNSLPMDKVPPLKIAILDIQLLAQQPAFITKDLLFSTLRQFFNEVHFIDTNSMTPILDRARWLHQFEAANVMVGGSVYISKDPTAAEKRLEDDLAQRYGKIPFRITHATKENLYSFMMMYLMLQPNRSPTLRKLITTLLKNGAKSTCLDQEGNTAVHLAIKQNDVRTLRRLLRRKADPNCRDGNYQTPLYLAVKMNNPAMVKTLLRHGANPTQRKSALELAQKKGYSRCAKKIKRALAKRAQPSALHQLSILKPASMITLKPSISEDQLPTPKP